MEFLIPLGIILVILGFSVKKLKPQLWSKIISVFSKK
jgi:hypothetical protein